MQHSSPLELLDQGCRRLGAGPDLFHADGQLSKVVSGPEDALARQLRAVARHELLEAFAAHVDSLVFSLLEDAGLHVYDIIWMTFEYS